MRVKLAVGQKVYHSGFRGVGIVVGLSENGTRVAADFPGTNGIIDSACNFTNSKKRRSPKQDRYSMQRGDYD